MNKKLMPTVYSLSDIEKLGEAGYYEQQAQEFLRLTGSTLTVRYIETGLYFNDKEPKQTRDIYEFTLKRGNREYTSTFGASLQDTWDRFALYVSPQHTCGNKERDFYNAILNDNMLKTEKTKWKKQSEKLKTDEYSSLKPTAYSILAGMQTYDVGTFDDFLACFGYEINSKESYENAQKSYNAVVEQYHKLCALYNEKEIEALSRIA